MGENTEQKIILENDIFGLKRQKKYALEDLAKLKAETAEVLAIRDKARAEYEDKQKDLTDIINRISEEKLEWANHRHAELAEIDEKKGEVKKILDTREALVLKEKELKEIEVKNTAIRNETRQLELKIDNEKKQIMAEKREIELIKLSVDKKEKELEDSKKVFKQKVEAVLLEIKSL